jgi:hypothetical protein
MLKQFFSLSYDVLVLNMFFNMHHYALRLQTLLWSMGEGRE